MIYRGMRSGDDAIVMLERDDALVLLPMTALAKRRSPTGYEWGYAGSGPSALAHSILAMHLGDEDKADEFYMAFKAKIVAALPLNDWWISDEEIERWLLGARRGYFMDLQEMRL